MLYKVQITMYVEADNKRSALEDASNIICEPGVTMRTSNRGSKVRESPYEAADGCFEVEDAIAISANGIPVRET